MIVTRIAAHAADLAGGNRDAFRMDEAMSVYRKALDWGGTDKMRHRPGEITEFRKDRQLHNDVCSMCGEYCSMKLIKKDYFKKK